MHLLQPITYFINNKIIPSNQITLCAPEDLQRNVLQLPKLHKNVNLAPSSTLASYRAITSLVDPLTRPH